MNNLSQAVAAIGGELGARGVEAAKPIPRRPRASEGLPAALGNK
jgi:hypothetical protein